MKIFNIIAAGLMLPVTAADTLQLGSTEGAAGAVLRLPVSFLNQHEIVAMQFDLDFPAAQVEVGRAAVATNVPGHLADSRELAAGKRRIVVFSTANATVPDGLVLDVPITLKSGAPQGGPTLGVNQVIFTNKQGQKFTPAVRRTQLDAWRLAHFTEAQRSDAATIGDDRDPDGDGIANLVEFLTGNDPNQRNAGAAVSITAGNNGLPQSLSLTFSAAKGVDTASLRVESSTDLSVWTQEMLTLTATGAATPETVELRATVPAGAATKKFFRLSGSRTPGSVTFVNSSGTQKSVAVDFDALSSWKQARFTAAQLAVPGTSGNDADPDGDGVSNLLEFFAGTAPLDAASHPQSTVELVASNDGQKRMVFTFRVSRGPLSGPVTVQTSGDLNLWTTPGIVLVPTGQMDADSIEVRAEVPVDSGSKFLRVKAGP